MYKCQICGVTEVEHKDDICELCALENDPYAQDVPSQDSPNTRQTAPEPVQGGSHIRRKRQILLGGGNSISNLDPYGNDMTPLDDNPTPSVQVYTPGQVPQQVSPSTPPVVSVAPTPKASSNQPISTGIVKNLSLDVQQTALIVKWCRSVFSGAPFSLDDDVTSFQVFPDFTGTSTNALGNACDQVIFYGKLTNGAVSENNDVEVYGRRDSNNNVIASSIKNVASGTTVRPIRAIGSAAIRLLTVLLVIFALVLVCTVGIVGTFIICGFAYVMLEMLRRIRLWRRWYW